jgi:WD40 repeat protein
LYVSGRGCRWPDAAIALSGGVQIVSVLGGGLQPFVQYDGGSRWFAWSPINDELAIGHYQSPDVTIVTPRASELRTVTLSGSGELVDGQYSPNGLLLAVESDEARMLRLHLWNVRKGREQTSIDEGVLSDSPWFSPDSRLLVTYRINESASPPNASLSMWDTATWRRRAAIASGSAFAWSPDSSRLAVAKTQPGGTFHVVLIDTANGAELRTLGDVDFYPPVTLTFSPNGTRVAVGGGGRFLGGYQRGDIVVFPTEVR